MTLLDEVCNEAPFAGLAQFRSTLERVSADWRRRGLLTDQELSAVMEAADKASDELRV